MTKRICVHTGIACFSIYQQRSINTMDPVAKTRLLSRQTPTTDADYPIIIYHLWHDTQTIFNKNLVDFDDTRTRHDSCVHITIITPEYKF